MDLRCHYCDLLTADEYDNDDNIPLPNLLNNQVTMEDFVNKRYRIKVR